VHCLFLREKNKIRVLSGFGCKTRVNYRHRKEGIHLGLRSKGLFIAARSDT